MLSSFEVSVCTPECFLKCLPSKDDDIESVREMERTIDVDPPTTVVIVLVTPRIEVRTVEVLPPTTLVTRMGLPVKVKVTV